MTNKHVFRCLNPFTLQTRVCTTAKSELVAVRKPWGQERSSLMLECSFFLSSVFIHWENQYWKNTIHYIFFQLSLDKTGWFLKDFVFSLYNLSNCIWLGEGTKKIMIYSMVWYRDGKSYLMLWSKQPARTGSRIRYKLQTQRFGMVESFTNSPSPRLLPMLNRTGSWNVYTLNIYFQQKRRISTSSRLFVFLEGKWKDEGSPLRCDE